MKLNVFYILGPLFHLATLTLCCKSSSNESFRSSRYLRSHRVQHLNQEGQLSSSHSFAGLEKGEQRLARLNVPYSAGADPTVTVSVFWSGRFYNTPLWVYIKKGWPISTSNFDKVSISNVSRGYSRLRLDNATPGEYFILVELLQDIQGIVELEVDIKNSNIEETIHLQLDQPTGFVTRSQVP